MNKINWNFDNTYSTLPEAFISKTSPVPVKSPELVIFNYNLAKELGLDFSLTDKKDLSKLFSGNLLPKGSSAIAQAYAGHQFGHFTMLGDGRAVLMGEHLSKNKERFDIQFKGSGKTPFSRNGDGRAALGPMLREYIVSEAMHYLNIPTTRSLAVVKTGENVFRETPLIGAVLTRVASSHIRVGTFQYALINEDKSNLKILFDYTLDRHYQNIINSKNPAVDLLIEVMEKQIELVTNWMRVGFIHGVMNTDNMSISGETIDYGPCAFMDTYDPKTVFSSIDHNGRYAYFNQPGITKWNLARFAECLVPLIDSDKNKSVQIATEIINTFGEIYNEKWLEMMRKKLGLFNKNDGDEKLINELLSWMYEKKADFTNTFCVLMEQNIEDNKIYNDESFIKWKNTWQKRIKLNNKPLNEVIDLMRSVNPLVIPRNHKVEEALNSANSNNLKSLEKLLEVLKKPYENQNNTKEYQFPRPPSDKKYQTFCGT